MLAPGALNRRYGWRKLAGNWTLVYFGNLLGSLFFAYFLVSLPGMLSADCWHTAAVNVAETKISMPWTMLFLRGIGASWSVFLAV